MSAELAAKYDLMVPRYTSYPTAPHFNQSVDGDTYLRWLGEIDPKTPLSLYFHIPFCDEMCWFCGCYTKIVKRYEPVADYLDLMLDEIALVAAALPSRFTASHLHWGGGSPTMLIGDDWQRTMDAIRKHVDIAADAEVAVEMDPRTATEDYVKALAAAGVNRASIGVQDYDDAVQKAINRIQPFAVTERVIGWLRAGGVTHVNMDLMYGLPHQTLAKVERMVELTAGLGPARIALFGYAHVPWMKSHQKMIDEDALPNAAERWRQFELASARLVELGYVKIGLDHFALPGDDMAEALKNKSLHRNFQGYTTDPAGALLGFGASAIGRLPQGYVQNLSPLKAYKGTIGNGNPPTARGIEFSDDDKLRGDIIERLMCELSVDLNQVCAAHHADPAAFAEDLKKLDCLVADEAVAVNDGRVTVLEAGRPLVRIVASAFDAYLDKGSARHSRAV
jgi:oxygen-independent coproporphyrinogen-3 oxidase